MTFFREKGCYTPKYNFCQSPDYFFCAFTSRCERDGYYNPYKFDDSYNGVLKKSSHESETKEDSKEEKILTENKETESKKSAGNRSYSRDKIRPDPSLEALIANRFCEVALFLTFKINNLNFKYKT